MSALASVIIRFHHSARIDLLRNALFSVAIQNYPNIQLVLVTQNLDRSEMDSVCRAVDDYNFFSKRKVLLQKKLKANEHVIYNIQRKSDARAELLNIGLKIASGRYVMFLDYDDVLYQDALTTLVSELEKSTAAIAVGGCRRAEVHVSWDRSSFILKKRPFLDRYHNSYDLLFDNFIPIHSFVLDRKKIASRDLVFNSNMKVLEDYDLLLRLVSKYRFDFSKLNVPICEYRIRSDNSNSTPFNDVDNRRKVKIWSAARKKVNKLKAKLRFQKSFLELGGPSK